MVSPQIDNGYMRIANEIVEAIMQAGLNGTQFRIVLAIWRYTYGFNRKSHNISLAFLEKVTGLYKRQIQRELKKLIEMNILLEVSKGKGRTTRELAFNKNYKLWRLPVAINIERRDVELDTSNRCLNRHLTGVGLDVSRGVGLDVARGVGLDNQEIHIKDNFKDNSKQGIDLEKYKLDKEVTSVLADFIENRKQMKKPATQIAVDRIVGMFRKNQYNNAEMIKCLDKSIRSGYQGVFELKENERIHVVPEIVQEPVRQFESEEQREAQRAFVSNLLSGNKEYWKEWDI